MQIAIGFVIGLVSGGLLAVVVRRLFFAPKSSTIDAITPVCDGDGQVDVNVTVDAGQGSTTTGIYWMIYDDPDEDVPDDPNDAGATHFPGEGQSSFDLLDLACSSDHEVKIAVWPEFRMTGAPVEKNFGPCTTTTTTTTTSTPDPHNPENRR